MIHLIVQYYAEREADRREEIDYCLRRNLADQRIACVHDMQSAVTAPEDIRTHPKYRSVESSEWLTFARAFQYANDQLAGQLVALANIDIFLADEFPAELLTRMSPTVVLALARWECDATSSRMWLDPNFAKNHMAFAQEMWIFRAPIQVQNCDFKIGILGCDHAIAHRLRTSGYWPVNDCLKFKICHLDRCRGKTGDNTLEFHRQQSSDVQSFPGVDGRMLVPMLQEEISLDAAAKQLGMSHFAKYRALVDIWNNNLRLKSFE